MNPKNIVVSSSLYDALKDALVDYYTAIIDLDGTLMQLASWDATPQGWSGFCKRYGKFHGTAIWKSKAIASDFHIKDNEEIAKLLEKKDHIFLTNRCKMLKDATFNLLKKNGFQAENLVCCSGYKVDFLAAYARVNHKKKFVIADDMPEIFDQMMKKLPAKSIQSCIRIELPPPPQHGSCTVGKHYGKVIGLSGKMGSGKDAATEILVKKIYANLKCVIVRFADSLKQFVSELMPDNVYSEHTKSNVVKFCDTAAAKAAIDRFNVRIGKLKSRDLNPLLEAGFLFRFLDKEMSWSKWHAQVGMYCRQDCGDDLFVHLAEQTIMEKVEQFDMVIVNDARFKNEWEMLMRLGVPMIRLQRDYKLRESSFNGRDPNHASEINLDETPFEHCIENNSNLEDLEKQLRGIVFWK